MQKEKYSGIEKTQGSLISHFVPQCLYRFVPGILFPEFIFPGFKDLLDLLEIFADGKFMPESGTP